MEKHLSNKFLTIWQYQCNRIMDLFSLFWHNLKNKKSQIQALTSTELPDSQFYSRNLEA